MKRLRSPAGKGRFVRRWIGLAVTPILSLVCIAAVGASAFADLKLPPRRRGDPPMRILRVASSDPSCGANCPEWISAEGQIMVGTAKSFAGMVKSLDGRRLPVLIHSHGGSVVDAVKMGALIRARGLAVAVARTLLSNCPETASKCASGRGRAITGGAACASACVLVLAGGVERLVGPVPLVGVHQITAVQKRTEGVDRLTSIRKFYEPPSVDAAVETYLTGMGVGEPVMTLLRKTPAARIRWLSDRELRASRLATLRLDSAAPILAEGANGLNGHAFEGDPPRRDLLTASGTTAFAPAAHDHAFALVATFAYRRGGGVVEATISARDAGATPEGAPPVVDLKSTAAPDGGEFPLAKPVDGAPMRATLPLASFCRLAHGGKLVGEPVKRPGAQSDQANPHSRKPTIVIDIAGMEGVKRLFDEACP